MYAHRALLVVLSTATAAQARAQSAPAACLATAEGMPGSLLQRASEAIGLGRTGGTVLRWRAHRTFAQPYQSDRTYEPFFVAFGESETWFDPATGAQREEALGGAYPGTAIPRARFATLTSRTAQWFLRDTVAVPAPDFGSFGSGGAARPINPWAAVTDFARTREVRVAGRCVWRDYPRIALERPGPFGAETLLVDPKSWVPVGLLRTEPHFLWGQVHVEYVWTNWDDTEDGGARYPQTAFRMVDGAADLAFTVTSAAVLPADSAPRLSVPDTALALPARTAAFANPEAPDTVRVGPRAYLLVTRAYTTGAVLLRDTVFLLDATLSEARARLDSTMVAQLFPGRHPVVLVVTDLAWPHIGGVRFWVANGATIVTHRAARGFLQRVLDRRWTLEPDLFETRRGRIRPTFRTVGDSLVLAGGELVLHAIDGVASEVALMGWLPAERFLWPGDYIQNTRAPSGYAREVLAATRRVGISPERFAAQHVRLASWRVIDSLHPSVPAAPLRDVPDGAALRVGERTVYTVVERGGQRTERGPRTEGLARIRYRGREVLAVIRTFATPSGPAIDSSIFDAATLAPIRHVGVHSSRSMTLDFAGPRVTGAYTPAHQPSRPIDHHMEARPYDSSIWDLVIAALPLREGYEARIPYYVYEQGGLVWYTARVDGAESFTLRDGTTADTWTVAVTEEGRPRARLWIPRTGPREVLRQTFYFGGGSSTTTR